MPVRYYDSGIDLNVIYGLATLNIANRDFLQKIFITDDEFRLLWLQQFDIFSEFPILKFHKK